jgi:hypothetical protein
MDFASLHENIQSLALKVHLYSLGGDRTVSIWYCIMLVMY